MKKVLLCAAFIAASFTSIAQVGVGTTTPDASAALEIESTTKGLLPPRLSFDQRNLITTPAAGLLIWCTTCGEVGEMQVFNGTAWRNISGAPQAGTATLTTTAASDINPFTAKIVSNITNQGDSDITEYGVCFSTSTSPTTADLKKYFIGTTTGSFTSSLSFLSSNTLYYVRAYAVNSIGTSYGNNISFTTLADDSGAAVCDGTSPTTVVEVTGLSDYSTTTTTHAANTKTIWMDRNLGASRAATAYNDYRAYGCLYQWGRGNDGHASINWSGSNNGYIVNGWTTTTSNTNSPGDALSIRVRSGDRDWRVPGNDLLWQGVSGKNNPCPSGFRVPTITELNDEFTASSINSNESGFNSVLKTVAAGLRSSYGYGLIWSGEYGQYLSSSVDGTGAYFRNIAGTHFLDTDRANSRSVRCIKD